MNTKAEFEKLMELQTEIALATRTGDQDQPNVRVVNFYCDTAEGLLYFTTFRDNEKAKEMEQNPKVAFTTVPRAGNEHVRGAGIARRSKRSVRDLADHFDQRVPGYKELTEQAGEDLLLYEILLGTVTVTLDFDRKYEYRIFG